MPPVSESPPKPMVAPERSLVQRMEALQRANDVRSRRAQLKRDLGTTEVKVTEGVFSFVALDANHRPRPVDSEN